MSRPIKKLSSGKINVAVWASEYNGQLSYKFTIQKSYKDKNTNEWENTNFLTITDMHDVIAICSKLINENIKEHEQRPQQQAQPKNLFPEQNQEFNDDIPF